MKERQAEEKGYHFTGCYSHNKEELKEKQQNYKKQGYKSIICNVPPSKLSRGHGGMGYSIYIEEKYIIDKRKEELNKDIVNHEERLAQAFIEYQQLLLKLEKRQQDNFIEYEKLNKKS